MAYILAVHVPIAGMSLLPVLAGWPLMLLPVHVVFLEMVIDPACSVAFEAEPAEPDIMQRRPRRPDEPLFGGREIAVSFLQGLAVLLVTAVVYLAADLWLGFDQDMRRSATFTTLLFANLALILSNRSWSRGIGATLTRPNKALWWVVLGATVVLLLVLYVPPLALLFHFVPPPPLPGPDQGP